MLLHIPYEIGIYLMLIYPSLKKNAHIVETTAEHACQGIKYQGSIAYLEENVKIAENTEDHHMELERTLIA